MSKSKKKCNILHAKRRGYERFGLFLNDQDIKDISNICKNGKELYSFRKQSLSRTKKLVKFKNKI